ncbi:hypothetical protein jhhlp_001237 [Lomentospora prolificans]|uniref:gamma-glutamylcyclotransferase n=1 Tax=Lomentospora prolificans TaxID=41688 RepID=A0A2N3NHR3_9PEZI|nr:hypothetical protein jhhlp_001237 [Lomentospora prolificans]
MPGASGTFYFAYGSNLWLQQMANRCPNSIYIGRAILSDYCWQINQRGFANVVPYSGHNVHGLVYQIDREDEDRLDRSDGVNSGAYSKVYRDVTLFPAQADLQAPTRSLVGDEAGLERAIETSRRRSRRGTLERKSRIVRDVLVYLSPKFIDGGDPREEYIHRVNSGIRDATALGIPREFFENVVRGSIPEQRPPRQMLHRGAGLRRSTTTAPEVTHVEYREPRPAPRQQGSRRDRRSLRAHQDEFRQQGTWNCLRAR